MIEETNNVECAECLTSYEGGQSFDIDRLVVCNRCMKKVCSPHSMAGCSSPSGTGYLCRLCSTQNVTIFFDM